MNPQVISYAPGDGAIAFTCIEERFNRDEGCFEQIAIGQDIPRETIEALAAKKFPGHLLIQMSEPYTRQETRQVEAPLPKKRGRPRKHPKMEDVVVTVDVPPQFRLCAPVFRVGPSTLRLGDNIYRYAVDEENIFWTRDGAYTDNNLSLWYLWSVTEERMAEDEEDRIVRNVNTRGAILWFLNHEKQIVRQYPEQDETTAASVDQLKEAVQSLQRAGLSDEEIRKLME